MCVCVCVCVCVWRGGRVGSGGVNESGELYWKKCTVAE